MPLYQDGGNGPSNSTSTSSGPSLTDLLDPNKYAIYPPSKYHPSWSVWDKSTGQPVSLTPDMLSLLNNSDGGVPTGSVSNPDTAQRNAIDNAHYQRSDATAAEQAANDAAYQRGQLGNSLYDTQAKTGQGLLDTVTKMVEDPNAGPMGLSAYAKYGGGAQAVSQGTGGQGAPSPYGGLLDELLGNLKGAVGPGTEFQNVNSGDLTTDYGKIDPNKAPTMTPENAAKAPDTRQALVDAWGAFNPDKTLGVDPGVKYPVPGALNGAFRMPIPGYADGGHYGFSSDAEAIAFNHMLQSIPEAQRAQVMLALSQIAQNRQGTPTMGAPIPGQRLNPDYPEPSEPAPTVPSAPMPTTTPTPTATPQPTGPLVPDSPLPTGTPTPGTDPYAGIDLTPPKFADGGEQGLTIGGEPHFIVDAQGNKVAALTEDGKPETVKPAPGGVEVIPEDPVRKAAYLEAKNAGTMLGNILGSQLYPGSNKPSIGAPPTPALATGGTALFPKQTDTTIGSGLGAGNEVPTAGGPSAGGDIGTPFKPATPDSLPTEATSPDFYTRLHGYAKLLGGALSGPTGDAIPDEAKRALNAGASPGQLLSAQALSTMAPSMQSNYFALLQQLREGNAADNKQMILNYRPASMSGAGGGGKIGG